MWFDTSKGQAKAHGIAYSPWQAFSEQRIRIEEIDGGKKKEKRKKGLSELFSSSFTETETF